MDIDNLDEEQDKNRKLDKYEILLYYMRPCLVKKKIFLI